MSYQGNKPISPKFGSHELRILRWGARVGINPWRVNKRLIVLESNLRKDDDYRLGDTYVPFTMNKGMETDRTHLMGYSRKVSFEELLRMRRNFRSRGQNLKINRNL